MNGTSISLERRSLRHRHHHDNSGKQMTQHHHHHNHQIALQSSHGHHGHSAQKQEWIGSAIRVVIKPLIKRGVAAVSKRIVSKLTKEWAKKFAKEQVKDYIVDTLIETIVTEIAKSEGRAVARQYVDNYAGAVIRAELNKPSNQAKLKKAGEKAASDYVDKVMKFGWDDLIPGWGTGKMIAQIQHVLASDAIERVVQAAVKKEARKIISAMKPEDLAEKIKQQAGR